MEFCNNVKKLFVLFILVVFFIGLSYSSEESESQPKMAEFMQGMSYEVFQEAEQTKVVYSFEGQDSAIQVGGVNFMGVVPSLGEKNSFISTNQDGSVVEAYLISSGKNSWTFGNQTVHVSEGMAVSFSDGKIRVYGNESMNNASQSFVFSSQNTSGQTFISFGNLSSVEIDGEIISGRNISINNIFLKEGSLIVLDNGYLLKEKSIAEWNGMTIRALDKKEVFFANDRESYLEWKGSGLFEEGSKLSGKGDGFSLKFDQGNPFAQIDEGDYFELRGKTDFEFVLEPRGSNQDIDAKIPLMETVGDFMMNQDGRTIYTESGKVFITTRTEDLLFENSQKDSKKFTSPLEILMQGHEKKVIVSNFNGFSIASIDEDIGLTDERYSNSINWIKASTELRYNYPTIEDFERISGGELHYFADVNSQDKVFAIRELIDFYETLPEDSKEKFTIFTVHNLTSWIDIGRKSNEHGAYYPDQGIVSILLNSQGSEYISFANTRHEFAHLQDYELSSHIKKIDESKSVLQRLIDQKEPPSDSRSIPYQTIFQAEWYNLFGHGRELLLGDELKWKDVHPVFAEDLPHKGYVSPYGATSSWEDIATYAQKISADPLFFKRHDLLGADADPLYKQKIELIYQKGLITDKEFEAVFYPERHFSKEEIEVLMIPRIYRNF